MGSGFTVIGVRYLIDARILSKFSPQAGKEFGKVGSPENRHWLVNEGGAAMGEAAPEVRGSSACPPCATATTFPKEKSSIRWRQYRLGLRFLNAAWPSDSWADLARRLLIQIDMRRGPKHRSTGGSSSPYHKPQLLQRSEEHPCPVQ